MSAGRQLRGSALLLVLWALLLLSAAVFGFARWMQQDIELHGESNRDLEARAMAHSGLAVALHPQVTKFNPGLEQDFGDGLGFRVKIVSEGSKLNIAAAIQSEIAPDPNAATRGTLLDLFRDWLRRRGLEEQEVAVFVDCLLDWVDNDGDLHRLNGTEDEGDYMTPDKPLANVEEIAQVRGSEPLTRVPGWQDELTIYGQGKIDAMSAEAEVLRLVPGLSEAHIQFLLTYRRGRDGADGTRDDNEIKSMDALAQLLRIGTPEPFNSGVGKFLGLNDPTQHISSEGRSGNANRQVEVVATKPKGGRANILFWKE